MYARLTIDIQNMLTYKLVITICLRIRINTYLDYYKHPAQIEYSMHIMPPNYNPYGENIGNYILHRHCKINFLFRLNCLR